FGRIDQALATANEAEQFIDAAAGATTYPPFFFYDSLVRLAAWERAGADERAALLAKVESNQGKLRPWAEGAPMNYMHKYRLVEAELARIEGRPGDARAAYDQAIDGALEHAYINDAALAYELAGRAYLAQGQGRLARYYLRDAHYSYQRWGARVKVEALEREYPQFLSAKEGAPSATITASGTTMSSALDFSSVLKASQTISGEIVLGSLLSRMLMLVMENAGAQRGVLLLNGPAGLTVDALGTAEEGITFLESVPLAEAARGTAPLLPEPVVNYVARTREIIVLNDATHESGYANDHYVALSQPKSVLCMPLLNRATLVGILYLENNLATSAFTTDRIEVLRLLSTQIAISVENASLYRNLERSEKKYRTIFEDSRDTIFITTPDGQIIDINPAGAALVGHSRERLLQMGAAQIYADPAQRSRFTGAMDEQGQVKDFEVRLRRSDGQEIDCLITATARPATASAPAVYEGIIRDITAQKAAEKERLRFSALQRELDVAHNIQSSLLPPASPAWPALDVQCYNVPARDVGGDLYAYHAFGDGRFALAVGDVSGKGMPAALLMAVSLASLQSIIQQQFAPEALLAYLDTAIIPYTRTTMQNCALVYLDIEPGPAGATLRAANAGCVTPLVRRADGSAEWLEIGGFPLGTGLGARAGYPPSELALGRGDLVILSSDGVIEAQNSAHELFGFERLEAVVRSGPADSAAAMLGHIQREVDAFMAGAELHDDLTLVVVKV
ncbi:MAG TPA: SpoIIE family protein phosphatase, partial [Herpetosiphonaceae bacterium]